MTVKTVLAAAAASLALLSTPVLAETKDGFTGEASLGYLSTSGNTDTQTFNGKLSGNYRRGLWGNAAFASALLGSKDDVATDERYALGYKATYDFTAHDYVFGTFGYDKDRFAGITQRTTEAVGYGRRLLNNPKHTLDAEIGAGLTQVETRDGDKDNSAVGLLNGKYAWTITDTSKFTQSLRVEKARNNTFVNPVSELKLVVAGNLFTTLGYEVRYNSDAPTGTRSTDTLTSVNLGYSFK